MIQYDGNRSPGYTNSLQKKNGNELEASPDGVYIKRGLMPVELLYWEQGSVGELQFQFRPHSKDVANIGQENDPSWSTLDLSQHLMVKEDLNLNMLQDLVREHDTWAIRTGSILDGGLGNDEIIGSEGRDVIFGGTGNDTLTGDGAADTFIFSTKAGNGNDVIKDFRIGEDKIALTQLLEIASVIDPKAPNWQAKDSVQDWAWDDANKVLTFTTADNQTNTVKFEGLTQSYANFDEFLKQNLIM